MASENLAKLQAAANRFASEAPFSPIAIDGGMGPNTVSAIDQALSYASSDAAKLGTANTPSANQGVFDAAQYSQGLKAGDQATFIMQNVVGMAATLNAVADGLKFDPAALVTLKTPTPMQNTVPDKKAFTVKPPPGMGPVASIRLWFRQQPTVNQVGFGIAGAAVLFFGFTRFKRPDKKPQVAGYLRGRR